MLEKTLAEHRNWLNNLQQQVQQLRKAPLLPPQPDDTMERENQILLSVATDLVELSLEPWTVEQTLNYYF